MRAEQREAIQVIAHRAHGHAPASNRVAVLARRAELTAMDIALRPHILE